jgi:sigma-B regulation protein RsbU (phosphoserine phosphatase)
MVERTLDLAGILATLKTLESRLRDREQRMAREIAHALAAATVVGDELDATRVRADLAAELERRQDELQHDLDIAQKVHQSLIPRSSHGEDLIVAVRYRAMRGVGGDLCAVLPRPDGVTFIAVADVTGHGVAAALLATRVVAHLRRLCEGATRPTEVLVGLNEFMLAHFSHTGLYMTTMLAWVDATAGRLRLAGAGHPPALLWRKTGGVARLGSQHTLLGVLPRLAPEAVEIDVPFQRGDRLLLYTDGITEARNLSGRFLGLSALEQILRDTAHDDIETAVEAVVARTALFRRGDPEDDVLVLAVELA